MRALQRCISIRRKGEGLERLLPTRFSTVQEVRFSTPERPSSGSFDLQRCVLNRPRLGSAQGLFEPTEKVLEGGSVCPYVCPWCSRSVESNGTTAPTCPRFPARLSASVFISPMGGSSHSGSRQIRMAQLMGTPPQVGKGFTRSEVPSKEQGDVRSE